jgi:hypothetical protein
LARGRVLKPVGIRDAVCQCECAHSAWLAWRPAPRRKGRTRAFRTTRAGRPQARSPKKQKGLAKRSEGLFLCSHPPPPPPKMRTRKWGNGFLLVVRPLGGDLGSKTAVDAHFGWHTHNICETVHSQGRVLSLSHPRVFIRCGQFVLCQKNLRDGTRALHSRWPAWVELWGKRLTHERLENCVAHPHKRPSTA